MTRRNFAIIIEDYNNGDRQLKIDIIQPFLYDGRSLSTYLKPWNGRGRKPRVACTSVRRDDDRDAKAEQEFALIFAYILYETRMSPLGKAGASEGESRCGNRINDAIFLIIIIIIIKNECHSNIVVDRLQGCSHSKKLRESESESRHAAVKSFDRRGDSCKNARTVQFSVTMFDSNYGSIVLSALVFAVMTTGRISNMELNYIDKPVGDEVTANTLIVCPLFVPGKMRYRLIKPVTPSGDCWSNLR